MSNSFYGVSFKTQQQIGFVEFQGIGDASIAIRNAIVDNAYATPNVVKPGSACTFTEKVDGLLYAGLALKNSRFIFIATSRLFSADTEALKNDQGTRFVDTTSKPQIIVETTAAAIEFGDPMTFDTVDVGPSGTPILIANGKWKKWTSTSDGRIYGRALNSVTSAGGRVLMEGLESLAS